MGIDSGCLRKTAEKISRTRLAGKNLDPQVAIKNLLAAADAYLTLEPQIAAPWYRKIGLLRLWLPITSPQPAEGGLTKLRVPGRDILTNSPTLLNQNHTQAAVKNLIDLSPSTLFGLIYSNS
jgi:hypothetical protein